MAESPLIDVGSISAPVTKLVEVLANGAGALYEPTAIVRRAKAEAKAAKIIHQGRLELSALEARAEQRSKNLEVRRQENIDSIAQAAAALLPEVVDSRAVDHDWSVQFFNRAQDVRDEDMQTIWARILAGEVSKPGTFGKRTLRFLETLEKSEALDFVSLCSYAIESPKNNRVLVENDYVWRLARESASNDNIFQLFANIGLISSEASVVSTKNIDNWRAVYFEETIVLSRPGPEPLEGSNRKVAGRKAVSDLLFAFRSFTTIGNELASIAETVPTEGFIDGLAESVHDDVGLLLQRESA